MARVPRGIAAVTMSSGEICCPNIARMWLQARPMFATLRCPAPCAQQPARVAGTSATEQR